MSIRRDVPGLRIVSPMAWNFQMSLKRDDRQSRAIVWGVEPMRGDAAVNGTLGVILSVTKAPGFDTRSLTKKVEDAIDELRR